MGKVLENLLKLKSFCCLNDIKVYGIGYKVAELVIFIILAYQIPRNEAEKNINHSIWDIQHDKKM